MDGLVARTGFIFEAIICFAGEILSSSSSLGLRSFLVYYVYPYREMARINTINSINTVEYQQALTVRAHSARRCEVDLINTLRPFLIQS